MLGPLLFILYTKDINTVLPAEVSHQEFADDIELEFSHRDPQVVATTLFVAVSSLEKWLTSIRLLLNRQKTQVMFIGARNAAPVQHVVRSQAEVLQTVTSVKCLGLHLDSNFSWTTHIDHLTNKCRQATACLWRYKKLFHQDRKTRMVC